MRTALQASPISVIYERRPDGGLRVYSDDVPGFVLSHPDASLVERDIIPALEVIISEMRGQKVRVRLAPRETVDEAANAPRNEFRSKDGTVRYVAEAA